MKITFYNLREPGEGDGYVLLPEGKLVNGNSVIIYDVPVGTYSFDGGNMSVVVDDTRYDYVVYIGSFDHIDRTVLNIYGKCWYGAAWFSPMIAFVIMILLLRRFLSPRKWIGQFDSMG